MHAPRFLALAALAALLGGCGGGTNVTAVAPASPTAPPIAAQSAFSATGSTSLSNAPQSAGQIVVALPSGAGFGGTLGLAAPSTIPPNTILAETLSNSASNLTAGTPALSFGRGEAQGVHPADAPPHTVLFYLQLASSTTLTLPNAPSMAFTVPAGLPSAAYYLALYDPLRPSLGWQLGFEGPATSGPTTLTFSAPSPAVPFTFTAFVADAFAVYAVSATAAAPTPAPSTAPAAAPGAPPAFTLSSPSATLLAAGAGATSTISDPSAYTGAFSAISSASGVATAGVSGKTVTITAVAAGVATITVSDAQARTATITVQVTTTNLPVQ